MAIVSGRTAAWLGGSAAALGIAAAGYLFAIGNSLAAIKVMLGILLVPGLAVFAVAGLVNMRHPNWYRSIGNVAAMLFLWGSILVLAPILLYMPWAPERFPLEEMPFGLPIVVWIGMPIVTVGAVVGMAWRAVSDWREGDRWQAVVGFVMLVLLGAVVAMRLAGG